MSDYLIESHQITKSYKGRTTVDHVNLHIKEGEIYGFVGPNGAGKSTTLKILMGFLKPDYGEFLYRKTPMYFRNIQLYRKIGALIERPVFYEQLSARQNLELHCSYMGFPNREEIDHVLDLLGLSSHSEQIVSKYSMGMKQRLAIARAILTKPELLVLDEPINGLDPDGIIDVRTLLRYCNQHYGMTVIISSHILSELEQLADTIGIMQDGKLLKEVSIQDIHEKKAEYIVCDVDQIQKAVYVLEEKMNIHRYKIVSDREIRIYDLTGRPGEINCALVTEGIAVERIALQRGSLEDYFFEATRTGGRA